MENTEFQHSFFFSKKKDFAKKKIHDKDNRNRILEQLIILDYD